MKLLDKKIFLTIGLVGTLAILLVFYLSTSLICLTNETCIDLFAVYKLWYWVSGFFIAPLILLFSCVTFWLPKIVYRPWSFFTLWFAPITMVLTYLILAIANSYRGGFFDIHYEILLLPLLYGVYFLISLVIIITGIVKFYKLI